MTTIVKNDLEMVESLEERLESRFSDVLRVDPSLTRKIVSYQDNKDKPFYRWFKYKEAYSATLVEYLLNKYDVHRGGIFDPFAGIGTTLFASALLGYNSEGIELLPVGQQIIKNRQYAEFVISKSKLRILKKWYEESPWKINKSPQKVNSFRITEGAYPSDNEKQIGQYLAELSKIKDSNIKRLMLFALMCVLESVSYTRKDGQYLRWDYRSGRGNGSNTFDKGRIYSFEDAIRIKLKQIITDIEKPEALLFTQELPKPGKIKLFEGSCLDILPQLKNGSYSAIITSPPYCNRYDYTRTYALEHAILGVKEKELLNLRQTMLTCTVENRPKEMAGISGNYYIIEEIFNNQELLIGIISYLENKKKQKQLNNNGIPRMVRGYFYEMIAVISECYRVLDKGSYLFMVNDNVRYAGVCIPADLILSKIAEDIGFKVESILVLPQNKGNSSQQMGGFGRKSLRKCIYVWRKI